MFGKEHVNVVYEEKRIEVVNEQENRKKLIFGGNSKSHMSVLL